MIDLLETNKEFIMSAVAIVISIFSLWLSHQQIKLSNKQNLFDRRLKNYLFCRDLIDNYKNNEKRIQYNKNNIISNYENICLQIITLCGCKALDDACEILNNPTNTELEKKFSDNMNKLQYIGMEAQLIFPEKEALILKKFVDSYNQVLFKSYLYLLCTMSLMPENQSNMSLKILILNLNAKNEQNQKKLLIIAYDNLEKTYKDIVDNKIENKVEKIIKLA